MTLISFKCIRGYADKTFSGKAGVITLAKCIGMKHNLGAIWSIQGSPKVSTHCFCEVLIFASL